MPFKRPFIKADVLRQRAEEQVRLQERPVQEPLSTQQLTQLIHELRVQHVELQMQNEELRRRQLELEQSRARNFELYDRAPVGYLTLDDLGQILEMNFYAANMFGVARSALHNKVITSFILPEDQDVYYLLRNKLLVTGEQQSGEIRLLRADGSLFWVLFQAVIARDNEYAITLVDISRRKTLEEELQSSKELYSTILHSAQEGFWIVDLQGKLLDVNDAYCMMIGYTREELLQMSIPDLEAVESPSDVERRCQEIKAQGSLRFESKHRRKDGQIIDVAVCTNFLPKENKLFTFIREITQYKRSAEILRSTSRYTRSLIEASLDPLVTISPEGMITDVNEASVLVTGMPRDQLIGTDFFSYFTEPEKARNGYLKVFTEGAVRDFPLAIRHVNGMVTEVLYNASVYRDKTGEVQGVFAAARDVTIRNKALRELKEAHDELEARVAERTAALDEANTQMKKVSFELVWAEEKERERIAGELHDQVGQSLLLAKMKLDALADTLAENPLHADAEYAATLIENSIQDIRTLTFRMRPPILDTAGIETTLEWLCSSINNDYPLLVSFSSDGRPKPLPSAVRYPLYQAVRELLLNVAKHARSATAQLSISSANGMICIQVSDQGVGFNHPDANMKHINNGGYGLYNVQQRIAQLGGSVTIDTAPGKGTTISVQVPVAADAL